MNNEHLGEIDGWCDAEMHLPSQPAQRFALHMTSAGADWPSYLTAYRAAYTTRAASLRAFNCLRQEGLL